MTLPQEFGGRYRVRRQLAEGGAGKVYLATDAEDNALVVVKHLRKEVLGDFSPSQWKKRFEQEIDILLGLDHPHIIRYLDHGLAEGLPYLVMEYLEGDTFDIWRQRKDIGPKHVCQVALQMLDGLQYLHQNGIVHRDLKPQNLHVERIDKAWRLTLIDFGFAKLIRNREQLTMTGVIVGTPAYMAPEQTRPKATITAASDLFAVGIILYEALAKSLPFQGETRSELAFAIANDYPRPLRDAVPSAPVELERLISRALDKIPDSRPSSAGSFRSHLARIMKTEGFSEFDQTTRAHVKGSKLQKVSLRQLREMLASEDTGEDAAADGTGQAEAEEDGAVAKTPWTRRAVRESDSRLGKAPRDSQLGKTPGGSSASHVLPLPSPAKDDAVPPPRIPPRKRAAGQQTEQVLPPPPIEPTKPADPKNPKPRN